MARHGPDSGAVTTSWPRPQVPAGQISSSVAWAALLVLVYLKEGETLAQVAAGFGVVTAMAWRSG